MLDPFDVTAVRAKAAALRLFRNSLSEPIGSQKYGAAGENFFAVSSSMSISGSMQRRSRKSVYQQSWVEHHCSGDPKHERWPRSISNLATSLSCSLFKSKRSLKSSVLTLESTRSGNISNKFSATAPRPPSCIESPCKKKSRLRCEADR